VAGDAKSRTGRRDFVQLQNEMQLLVVPQIGDGFMNEVCDPTDDTANYAERRARALWWQGIAVAVIATLALAPWDVAIFAGCLHWSSQWIN